MKKIINKEFDYIIIGFGNSALGFIIGKLESNKNLRILVIEEKNEHDLFDEDFITNRRKIYFGKTIKQKKNIKKETPIEHRNIITKDVKKRNNLWTYSNIIGHKDEYPQGIKRNMFNYNNMQRNLITLNQSYHFENFDDGAETNILENYENVIKIKENKEKYNVLTSKYSYDNKKTFKDKILEFIRDGNLVIKYGRRAFLIKISDTVDISGNKKGIKIKYLNKKKNHISEYNFSKLVLACGNFGVPEILWNSGIGNEEGLKENNIPIKIENKNIGKNIYLSMYVERYFREDLKKYPLISKMDSYFCYFDKFIILQFILGILLSFLNNSLYNDVLVLHISTKFLLFILLASFESFTIFIFRRNSYISFGCLVGIIIIIINYLDTFFNILKSWQYLVVYYVSCYIFFYLYIYIYYAIIQSNFSNLTKDIIKIYSKYSIFSFYKKKKYINDISIKKESIFYDIYDTFFSFFCLYIGITYWCFKDLFITRIETYSNKKKTEYYFSKKIGKWILTSNSMTGKGINNLLKSFGEYYEFIKSLYICESYSRYDDTISNKLNKNSIINNIVIGNEITGSCVSGKNWKNSVVSKNDLLLFGSNNIFIIGNPIINSHIKSTLTNTKSLLVGYIFSKK